MFIVKLYVIKTMLRANSIVENRKKKKNAKFTKRKRFEEIKRDEIKLLSKNYRDAFVLLYVLSTIKLSL